MITIQVFSRRDGKPVDNRKVSVSLSGVRDARTDQKGEAHFDMRPGRGKVWVDSSMVYEGDISGRCVVYV